ncbi:MAG: hypothetical protein IPM25_01780 [Chloracidobacterium sp.]|nr:hypothetical protein [Chloracidobacterium sp.]
MSRYRSFLSFIFLISAAVCVAGQGTIAATARDVKERIHVGDIVDVDVLGSFDYDWRGGLNPEGFLDNFNKVATPVFALCRTPDELAGVIEKEYGVFLRTPDVRVRIVDRSNRPVAYVHGAVKNPHRFRLLRPASLIELLVYSGGITDRSRGEVTIFRNPALNCTRPTGRVEGSPARIRGLSRSRSLTFWQAARMRISSCSEETSYKFRKASRSMYLAKLLLQEG